MKSRRKLCAEEEGEPSVRPLSVLWRFILVVAIASLLAVAIKESIPEPEAAQIQQAQTVDEDSSIRQIDWDSLPGTIVAWVEVPGTNIDEPIAQALPGNPNYFLYHDALGQGAYGTPANCKFFGVMFRSSSVRRSIMRRCARMRTIGAGRLRNRTRTCCEAILAYHF